MSDTVQKIKERLSIVEVVQPYVKLAKAGKYWKGLSPFNREKTPSFFVSPDRGLYHCFSSGKGGDMFTFIEEMEGVDFKGALAILAEKAGVELRPEPLGARDERERVYDALEAAKDFFVSELKKRRIVVYGYLIGRGLSEATIQSWSLGYAPNEWRALHDELMAKGVSEGILERAGLTKRPDRVEDAPAGEFYDRFRGRIMFPIRDPSGRVIGFSGRIFEDDQKHPQSKYLNSPETPVFDKSRVLYGIDRAREGIRRLGASLLVEGQMDLLMAHQAGFNNSVATSGTAFTKQHAEVLKRYSNNLLIGYDGDRAGIAAAGRAAAIALGIGMDVKVVRMPPGIDPADLIKEDPQRFKDAVRTALHIVDFYLAHLTDAKYDARTFRLEVSRTVLPYVALIQNAVDRAHFTKQVAEVLGVPDEAVASEVAKVGKNERAKSEEQISLVSEPFLSRADRLERLLSGIEGTTDDAAALFEADFFLERYPDPAARRAAIEELKVELAKEERHERYRETLAALHAAERLGDSAKSDSLLKELARLAKTL